MSKHERLIHIPSITISAQSAEAIDTLIDQVEAQRLAEVTLEDARALVRHQPGQANEHEMLNQLVGDAAYFARSRANHGARYTFISEHGSTQFVGEDFSEEDIPRDLDAVLIEVKGSGERLIALHVKARTQANEVTDPNLNRILVQSSTADRAWVNDVHDRLRAIIDKEQNVPRHLVYGWMPLFIWTAFVSVVFLQYRILSAVTGFSWRSSLNGLQLLAAFVVLVVELLLTSWGFQKFLHYSFPYFELEGNTSRRRKVWRWPLWAGLGGLYSWLVVTVVKFVLGIS